MGREGEKRRGARIERVGGVGGGEKGRESGVKEEERQNAEGRGAESKGQSIRGGDRR